MKSEFKTRFLQHLIANKEEGFTLVELLVVIIIIGILSAIALPSFMSQANKAKQSEAKTYVNAFNKGQQAFFAENNGFSGDPSALGVGLQTLVTKNYTYTVVTNGTGTSATAAVSAAVSGGTALKAYGGLVYQQLVTGASDYTTVSLACETNSPVTSGGVSGITAASGCPGGSDVMKK